MGKQERGSIIDNNHMYTQTKQMNGGHKGSTSLNMIAINVPIITTHESCE